MAIRAVLHELRRIGGALTSAKQVSIPTSLNIGTSPNLATNVEDALRELSSATGGTGVNPSENPQVLANPIPAIGGIAADWSRVNGPPTPTNIETLNSGSAFFFRVSNITGTYTSATDLGSFQQVLGPSSSNYLGRLTDHTYLALHRSSADSTQTRHYLSSFIAAYGTVGSTTDPFSFLLYFDEDRWIQYLGYFRGNTLSNAKLTNNAVRILLERVEAYSLGSSSETDTMPTSLRLAFPYGFNPLPDLGSENALLAKASSVGYDFKYVNSPPITKQCVIYFRQSGGNVPTPLATWNGSSYNALSPWSATVPGGGGELFIATAVATYSIPNGTWSTGAWTVFGNDDLVDRPQSRTLLLYRRLAGDTAPTAPTATWGGTGYLGNTASFSQSIPTGTAKLWVAQANASRAAGGSWTTSSWNVFPVPTSATDTLRGIEYSADGVNFNTTPRTTGYIRLQRDDGDWTGPIRIGVTEPFTGEWSLVNTTWFQPVETGSLIVGTNTVDLATTHEVQIALGWSNGVYGAIRFTADLVRQNCFISWTNSPGTGNGMRLLYDPQEGVSGVLGSNDAFSGLATGQLGVVLSWQRHKTITTGTILHRLYTQRLSGSNGSLNPQMRLYVR